MTVTQVGPQWQGLRRSAAPVGPVVWQALRVRQSRRGSAWRRLETSCSYGCIDHAQLLCLLPPQALPLLPSCKRPRPRMALGRRQARRTSHWSTMRPQSQLGRGLVGERLTGATLTFDLNPSDPNSACPPSSLEQVRSGCAASVNIASVHAEGLAWGPCRALLSQAERTEAHFCTS